MGTVQGTGRKWPTEVLVGDEPMDFMDWQQEANKPKVAKRPWMDEKVMELVTLETLEGVIDECVHSESGFYAWDVETTGLDSRVF